MRCRLTNDSLPIYLHAVRHLPPHVKNQIPPIKDHVGFLAHRPIEKLAGVVLEPLFPVV